MISDGAAALVVTSERFATSNGLKPIAKILSSATSGTEPAELFTAPVEAVQKALAICNRSLADIDLFEINEAFAVQVLACERRLDLSPEKVNVHGGAIALGHPIGASGARALTTLLHAMRKRDCQTSVAALCLGGGNAVAMVVERCG
jgi:acetyl-CoA C-acetyltransferase